MASALATAAKNSALDHIGTEITTLSLHTADPGATGINEVSGGTPAYARKTCAWSAASNGQMYLSGDVTFDVPATTVAYVGLWNGAAFFGAIQVTTEVFAAQGQYKFLAASSHIDPS